MLSNLDRFDIKINYNTTFIFFYMDVKLYRIEKVIILDKNHLRYKI